MIQRVARINLTTVSSLEPTTTIVGKFNYVCVGNDDVTQTIDTFDTECFFDVVEGRSYTVTCQLKDINGNNIADSASIEFTVPTYKTIQSVGSLAVTLA